MSFGAGGFGSQPFAGYTSGSSFTAVATMPMLTASGALSVLVGAAGVASMPMMTGAGAAAVQVHAVTVASMPMMTALAAAAILVQARGDARMPLLTLDARVTTSARRGLHSWQQCPRPASGFTECAGAGKLRRGRTEPV
jgi:hypothetical protein